VSNNDGLEDAGFPGFFSFFFFFQIPLHISHKLVKLGTEVIRVMGKA